MKIIGLLPVRNEDWVLPVTLPALNRFVDAVIVLDGHSSDRTVEFVRQAGGTVLAQEGREARYGAWRQRLLDAGRAAGGTHFVWLDADEAFTSVFLHTFRQRLASMRPGHKLGLDWLCLWKDPRRVRTDANVWSRITKDFVICDDGYSSFQPTRMHEGRTPGANVPERLTLIPREEGAVLHFQFAAFHRFQMKQAFMRCREWILKTGPAWEINEKYAITKDDDRAITERLPDAWFLGMDQVDTLSSNEPGLYLMDIKNYFAEHGPAFFEPLEIWHLPELMALFVQTLGRRPKPAFAPSTAQRFWRRGMDFINRRIFRGDRP